MKRKAFCLMLLTALFSVSCGDGSGSSASPTGDTTNTGGTGDNGGDTGGSTATELEGTWILTETGYTETYTFSGSTFTATYASDTKGTTVDTGTFVIGDAVTGLSAKKLTYTILKTTVDGTEVAVKDVTNPDIFSVGTGWVVFGNDKGTLDEDGFPTALETRQYTKQ